MISTSIFTIYIRLLSYSCSPHSGHCLVMYSCLLMYALQICNVPFRQADGWLCKYSFSVELLAGFGIAVAAQVCIVVSVSDPKCLFKSFSMCLPFVYSIHSSFWLNCLSMQDRCLPSNLSGAGTVFGILLGVASPAAGAAAWLIFTYSYRQAKRRIVLGVFKYLIVEDVADASSLGCSQCSSRPICKRADGRPGQQTPCQAGVKCVTSNVASCCVQARACFASSLSAEHIVCDA